MCKRTGGKGHGPMCNKVPVADAVSNVKEPPAAPSAAAADADTEASDHGLQQQEPNTPRAMEKTNETISVPTGYSVVAAFYGDASRGRGRDVTDIVKSREASGQVLRASNELFGDPVFGTEKTLFVDIEVSAPASSTDCDSQASAVCDTQATSEKDQDQVKDKGKGMDKS